LEERLRNFLYEGFWPLKQFLALLVILGSPRLLVVNTSSGNPKAREYYKLKNQPYNKNNSCYK